MCVGTHVVSEFELHGQEIKFIRIPRQVSDCGEIRRNKKPPASIDWESAND